MDTDYRHVQLAAAQAAEWLERLKNPGPGDAVAFVRWLKISALNVRELLLATALDTALRCVDRERAIDVHALLARAESNVITLASGEDSGRASGRAKGILRRLRQRAQVACAARAWQVAAGIAAVMLTAITVLTLHGASTEQRIATEASEWRSKLLPDGTLVRMGPRTHLRIEMGSQERLVHLLRGEALFHVAKDARRPFIVHTARAEARALGTIFAVSQFSDRVLVTVEEGVVAVRRAAYSPMLRRARSEDAALRLTAGQQVAIADSVPLAVEAVDVPTELAWADGRLIFVNTTLAEAVDAFNRRNSTQIRLEDPELGTRRIIGAFKAADPESFVEVLLRSQGIRAAARAGRPGLIRLEAQHNVHQQPSRQAAPLTR